MLKNSSENLKRENSFNDRYKALALETPFINVTHKTSPYEKSKYQLIKIGFLIRLREVLVMQVPANEPLLWKWSWVKTRCFPIR